MKDLILYLVILLLGGFLFMKMCGSPPEIPDNSEEVNKLTKQISELQTHNLTLQHQRDSLLKIPEQIKTKIIYRERQIDENIAEDSTNAINEYRKAMVENQELPESSGKDPLTFREIGIGAKLMAKVPKLGLTVKTYEEVIEKDKEIFDNYEWQIKGHKDLSEIQNLEINRWKMAYDKESAWYNSKELWFGIGVVIAGGIAILAR